MQQTTSAHEQGDDPRVSELTRVVVITGEGGSGGLRNRMFDVRTVDLPRLNALLDELQAR